MKGKYPRRWGDNRRRMAALRRAKSWQAPEPMRAPAPPPVALDLTEQAEPPKRDPAQER